MKKLSLLAIIGFAAALTACGDDSSSAGGTASCTYNYKATEFMPASKQCIESDEMYIDMLGCSNTANYTAERGSGCPSGATVKCGDQGVTTYLYEEGATCGNL